MLPEGERPQEVCPTGAVTRRLRCLQAPAKPQAASPALDQPPSVSHTYVTPQRETDAMLPTLALLLAATQPDLANLDFSDGGDSPAGKGVASPYRPVESRASLPRRAARACSTAPSSCRLAAGRCTSAPPPVADDNLNVYLEAAERRSSPSTSAPKRDSRSRRGSGRPSRADRASITGPSPNGLARRCASSSSIRTTGRASRRLQRLSPGAGRSVRDAGIRQPHERPGAPTTSCRRWPTRSGASTSWRSATPTGRSPRPARKLRADARCS